MSRPASLQAGLRQEKGECKMKKWWLIVSAVLVMALVSLGCSSTSNEQGRTQSDYPPAPAATAVPVAPGIPGIFQTAGKRINLRTSRC